MLLTTHIWTPREGKKLIDVLVVEELPVVTFIWFLRLSMSAWNLQEWRAKQYKLLRERRKSCPRQTVRGAPDWPCESISFDAQTLGSNLSLIPNQPPA